MPDLFGRALQKRYRRFYGLKEKKGMEKETYEKIIEVLTEKLSLTEWRLSRAEKENKELKKENERLRSEK